MLRQPAFRAFMLANVLDRAASAALAVLLGFQVYELTGNPLDLGWLGLAEAIPGVTLVLYGGHVADRHSRRRLVLLSSMAPVVLVAVLAICSGAPGIGQPRIGQAALLAILFAVAFLSGVARAFMGPALTGLEAQVVPLNQLMRGTSLLATTARLADVFGPLVGGLAWSAIGGSLTYAAIAGLFALATAAVALGIPDDQALPERPAAGSTWREIVDGVRYVFADQVLVGSMALDLFAVFFGGATALLPVFATDILHAGPAGLGLLRAAAGAGSLAAALLAGRYLPERRAGRILHAVIAGFGLSIVVFGLSRSMPLSLLALFAAGLCDGTSVVIRRAILRLASPDAMRGRISAVKSVFVGSSNEIGAFESGFLAHLIGPVATVWSGGLITIVVVALVAWRAPRLRRLDLKAFAAPSLPPDDARVEGQPGLSLTTSQV